MLEPRAVAVVGASRDRGEHRPARSRRADRRRIQRTGLSGQPGRRPRSRGCRAYRLGARSARPASTSPSSPCRASTCSRVVDDCAAAGVKSLVVITAGFAEAGDEGRARQQELVERVRGYGMRMVGPNCMGLLNASPGGAAERVVLADVSAGRTRRPARRRAARSASRSSRSPPTAASACRRSSASATRPTSRATICSSTGKRTPRPASSCSTSSRSATRAASRGWRGASAAPNRSSR